RSTKHSDSGASHSMMWRRLMANDQTTTTRHTGRTAEASTQRERQAAQSAYWEGCAMKLNKIYNEDNITFIKRIPDDFVDLTVTSPPYDNLRDYKGYTFDFETL